MPGFVREFDVAAWIGPDGAALDAGQMALRAFIVFVTLVVLVRTGKKRLLARGTAFDFVAAIVIGSVISRAVTGNAPFLPTLAAAAALAALHFAAAYLAFRWRWFRIAVEGTDRVLLRDGKHDRAEMARAFITDGDLERALRVRAGLADAEDAAEVRLERSGEISVRKRRRISVEEVRMRDGVQEIRLVISA